MHLCDSSPQLCTTTLVKLQRELSFLSVHMREGEYNKWAADQMTPVSTLERISSFLPVGAALLGTYYLARKGHMALGRNAKAGDAERYENPVGTLTGGTMKEIYDDLARGAKGAAAVYAAMPEKLGAVREAFNDGDMLGGIHVKGKDVWNGLFGSNDTKGFFANLYPDTQKILSEMTGDKLWKLFFPGHTDVEEG